MVEWIRPYIPNLLDYFPEFLVSIKETLIMLGISGIFTFILGLTLGIVLVVSKPTGILPNRWIHGVLDRIVNFFRSIPFIILLAALIPITRLIMGTGLGVKGAIFPLVVGATPFFLRQVDMALSNVDPGLIEAAQAMGSTPIEIIFRVLLRESIPSLARGTSITMISLIGLTAMGGAVGGGGIGAFVIRYGYNRFMTDITYVSVVVIWIMVSIIQSVGNLVVKKTTH
ncbi:MAG: methionine ABC transporter permease [Erysipelotrichaceae bacterium]